MLYIYIIKSYNPHTLLLRFKKRPPFCDIYIIYYEWKVESGSAATRKKSMHSISGRETIGCLPSVLFLLNLHFQ